MSILGGPAIFDAICFVCEEHRMLRCTGHNLVRELFLGGDTRTSNPEPGNASHSEDSFFFFLCEVQHRCIAGNKGRIAVGFGVGRPCSKV